MRVLALLLWTWIFRSQPSLSELIIGSDELYSCATFFTTPFDNTDGTIAQVQFLNDNPFACESDISSFQNTNLATTGEPQALVALAGNCTVRQKVRTTELISKQYPALRFLILVESSARLPGVLNLMLHSQERSECQISTKNCKLDTQLTLVSVNRDCGDHLLDYIHKHSNVTLAKGGPPVFLFSDKLDCKWQAIIQLISLILFSFSGSFFLAHVLFSKLCPGRQHQSGSSDPSSNVRRSLLSEASVEQFVNPEAVAALFELKSVGSDDNDCQGPSCAVCLESIVLPCKISILPCGHPFHQECIMPWLTERQACCPLCKLVLVSEQPNSTSDEDSVRTRETARGGLHALRLPWLWGWSGMRLLNRLPVQEALVTGQIEDLNLEEQVTNEIARVDELELSPST